MHNALAGELCFCLFGSLEKKTEVFQESRGGKKKEEHGEHKKEQAKKKKQIEKQEEKRQDTQY